MSPNNKTIRDLDGLPEGEIRLLVSQTEQRTVQAMETKLDEHREAIEGRLDQQDTKLESMQQDLSALVGSSKIPGLVQSIKATVEAGVSKQNEWHEGDLTYRGEVKNRLGSLEDNTSKLTEQVRMIRWFVATSNVCVKCLTKCIEGLKTEAFWKVFGVGLLLWFVSHYAPKAEQFLKHILIP